MSKYVLAVGVLVLLTATIFASSAFTSSEVVRDATIGVEADNNAIISLAPGTVGNSVAIGSNGQLTIDATPGSATGVNVGAQFDYGNASAPTSDYAFSITNADSQQRDFNLEYNNVVDNQGVSDTVNFKIYDDTGTEVGTVTPSSGVSFSSTSGQTHYVVLELDTRGLDSAADLSGDLRITA